MKGLLMWLLIPRGLYCQGMDYNCPFWFLQRGEEPQNNGYCSYLKKGDWQIEYSSLLWDGCKECGRKL